MPQFATKTGIPRYLREQQERVEKIALEYGLDFFPVVFEMLTYDQMNEIAAYGGFPNRYPHWRFGMDYERLSKSYEYGLSKIYEMVINNNPSFAYLLEGNSLTDQKLVMCHVYGHVDFFKNNYTFRATDLDATGKVIDTSLRRDKYTPNRKWIDKMANHGSAVRRAVDRHGIEKVEELIDQCLSLENLIDPHSPFIVREREEELPEEPQELEVPRLQAKEYMDSFINPEDYISQQRERLEEEREQKRKFPPAPRRDVLKFLLEHAPLERWERTVVSVIREEAYYFFPQMQTKILNEGWACVDGATLVFTERGVLPMRELTAAQARQVCDGDAIRQVTATNVLPRRPTRTVVTRRGLVLTGSANHRVRAPDGSWKRLDELQPGDDVRVSGGQGLWTQQIVKLDYAAPRRVSLHDVAEQAGVSIDTVLRHRAGRRIRRAGAVAAALESYDSQENQALPHAIGSRRPVDLPSTVSAALGALMGYLVGDGHVSEVKRHIGLTTADEEQAVRFLQLAQELFGVPTSLTKDEGRWRVVCHSATVVDYCRDALGLCVGRAARRKLVPEVILRSPEPVVREFLRAYFDCDGYAGGQGVILSTVSEELGKQVQLLLLNYGILTRRRQQTDGCWHVHAAGKSAALFAEKVGFGLLRKQRALDEYVCNRRWFKAERWSDEVVSIEEGFGPVYDITVEKTHCYAAAGFINHNSYWHSKMMTERVCDWSEIVEYADNNAGVMATGEGQLNPYKLGVELFRHVEERWNKGQFGREWDECDDMREKQHWDLKLGLGKQKIFEVRQLYNDVTFIDEFLTPEFALEHKLFTFGWSNRNERFEIQTREFQKVKQKLLFQLTNAGNPIIMVEDANFENRGELLLTHEHRGVDLRDDYARECLSALVRLWKRPVCLRTRLEGKSVLLRYDGKEHTMRDGGE